MITKSRFRNKSEVAFYLGVVWILCNIVSFFGFYAEYETWPHLFEALLYNQLTVLFSMPKSFGDLVFLTNRLEISGTLPMILLFWPTIIYLIFNLFTKRQWILFVVVSIVLLLASWNWLIVATGMMGI